jgi:hypothetical protein
MSIGPDIKEALDDVGISYNILLPVPLPDSEKMVAKSNTQGTKPFVREFFLSATLSYDTKATVGAVIKTVTAAVPYMVMTKTPTIFEDEIIENKVILYKCNVSGEILRLSGESTWDNKYQKHPVFQIIRSNAYGLQVEQLTGSGININEEISAISTDRHDLYVPSYYGIKELDRYQPVSGEFYLVKAVKTRIHDDIDVAELITDER